MAGLLSTTLTGSMEAIHMVPVNEAHLKTSSSQPPALEQISSNSKTSSDTDTASAQESLQQSTAAGSENDSSVLNSSRDVNARNVQQSSNSSNYQSKDNPKSQSGSVTDKSRTENKDKTSSPATAGSGNDSASLSKTKSMKRKRCDEDSESENKSVAAKKGSAERVSGEKKEEEEQTKSPAATKGRATFFVKDWEFVQVLGEGAYGEVKLAYNVKTREAVAVKIVDTSEKGVVWDDVRKEVCIHRMISHQNIIKFYGVRREGDIQYLFLEYASGGELFDRIEPDVGMPQAEAQKYFRQLIDGVEYLHSKGIAHRDIKPENLLLDENDDLKIADFGLATIFRYQEKWRYLERLCGSAPYLAPEVINNKPYRAEPADLWSCGIVFVAMLGGELPWDAAVLACVEYVNWRECHIEYRPWNKIDNLALCLLRRLLVDKPEKRYTIADIRKNQWFNKNFSNDRASQLSEGPLRKRGRTSESDHSPGLMTCSQPTHSTITKVPSDPECLRSIKELGDGSSDTSYTNAQISFSQPAQADDMLLSSQFNGTQSSSQTPMQKLVRRMTRFFSKQSRSEVHEELDRVFSLLGYNFKHCASHVLTVHTTDRRQSPLTFKTMILEMGESFLIDFRLSKGDGLEFKRHFIRIREHMKSVICKVPPSWPNISYI